MGRRTDARAGCKALLDAYKAAHTDPDAPEYLAHVSDHRPGRVTGRSAWVNKELPETGAFGANVHTRTLLPSITICNKLASNEQATDEQDAIVDALNAIATDRVSSAAARAITKAPLLWQSVEDVEIESDDGIYAGARVTFRLDPQGGY